MTVDMTVAKYLAERLPHYGVTHVFELVGGMITVMLDAMHQNPELRIVSVHHEQSAGFAAEGFARIAGRPSVAMATSGPGATNLVTAIGSCYFDSTPVVFITGQVNRHEIGRGRIGRQGGFQETDIISIAAPITKAAIQVLEPAEFPHLLDEAFNVAISGRPGPVLLDIPMDVQQSRITVSLQPSDYAITTASPVSDAATRGAFIASMVQALQSAKRPLLLLGGGVRSSNSASGIRRIAAAWGIPVVTSLMGLDAIPTDSPERVGFIGSYGNRWAVRAVGESDLLLVLGSRLDIRQTGSDIAGFQGQRKIFHVDIDPSELNTRVGVVATLVDDIRDFVASLEAHLPQLPSPDSEWLETIRHWQASWPDTTENVPRTGLNPNRAIRQISSSWTDLAAVITDVGQHQMWAAQSIRLSERQRYLTSGGMGSMGFGLPATIGAALAVTPSPVCLIAGDGGFQLNIQELQTVVRERLPVRLVVLDNGAHGMVRQFQQSYFESRYYSTVWGYSAPNFVAVAQAYGIQARNATTHSELQKALDGVSERPAEPALIRIPIDAELNVYPKMAFGRPFGSMEPDVQPVGMEGT